MFYDYCCHFCISTGIATCVLLFPPVYYDWFFVILFLFIYYYYYLCNICYLCNIIATCVLLLLLGYPLSHRDKHIGLLKQGPKLRKFRSTGWFLWWVSCYTPPHVTHSTRLRILQHPPAWRCYNSRLYASTTLKWRWHYIIVERAQQSFLLEYSYYSNSSSLLLYCRWRG